MKQPQPKDVDTAGRELRAFADANMIQMGADTTAEMAKEGREALVELEGRHYCVSLTCMNTDDALGISVYNVFISLMPMRALPTLPTDAVCQRICRAIYDVKWQEPRIGNPFARWFMRVRKTGGQMMTIRFQGGLLDGHEEEVLESEWRAVQKVGFTGPDRQTVRADAVYRLVGQTFVYDPALKIEPGETARVVLLPQKFWPDAPSSDHPNANN